MAHATETPTISFKIDFFRPFKWLLRLEREYRQAQKLKSTEPCYLEDMGITGKEANAEFYTRVDESHRWTW